MMLSKALARTMSRGVEAVAIQAAARIPNEFDGVQDQTLTRTLCVCQVLPVSYRRRCAYSRLAHPAVDRLPLSLQGVVFAIDPALQ